MKEKYKFSEFFAMLLALNAVTFIPCALFYLFGAHEINKTIYFNTYTEHVYFITNLVIVLYVLSVHNDKLNASIEAEITLTSELEIIKNERGASCYEYLNTQLSACIDDRKQLVSNNNTLRAECLRKSETIDTYKRRESEYNTHYNKINEIMKDYVSRGGEILQDTTLDRISYAGFKLSQALTQNKF